MISTNELAAAWFRVSTGGQDEENQVPEVERYCAAHGYTIAERYTLNDKSASKGEQQAKLDQMLHDMREGKFTVLVCWRSNRVERRGVEAVFNLIRQVKDAGGRIESVQEGQLDTGDVAGEVLTSITAIIDHQFSVKLSQDVRLAHDRIRANGGVGPGGLPWGYRIDGPKYGKKLIPTDLCREYAPKIFARVIAGESWRAIAAWLDVEGVPTKMGGKWNEGSIRKLIHNRVYAGRLQNENKTVTLARCEAVIPADVFDRAQEALRRRPQRRPPRTFDQPMLANLKCARCEDSPMYRLRIQSRDGKSQYLYYRCAGRGAQRKGCGNMVPLEQTDTIVAGLIFMTDAEPYRTRHWVEGTNWDAEISDVKQDIREAAEAERFDDLPELRATLDQLRERNRHAVKGHWENDPDTGMTVGDYFDGLDADGKREYLKTRDIRVEKATPVLEPGASKGIRVVIDGKDHGIFAYPALIS
jgi:DNA invertase Pin-like site-specific DNA recombinase